MTTSTSSSAQISEPTSSSESGPVYFWREYDEPDGFLSQWYDSSFEHDGIMYRSAEMWMMIQKAKLFGDEEIAGLMMETADPAEHKALGRKVKGFNREKWDQSESWACCRYCSSTIPCKSGWVQRSPGGSLCHCVSSSRLSGLLHQNQHFIYHKHHPFTYIAMTQCYTRPQISHLRT